MRYQTALRPDFSLFSFFVPSRSLVLIGIWLRFTRQVRYVPTLTLFTFLEIPVILSDSEESLFIVLHAVWF